MKSSPARPRVKAQRSLKIVHFDREAGRIDARFVVDGCPADYTFQRSGDYWYADKYDPFSGAQLSSCRLQPSVGWCNCKAAEFNPSTPCKHVAALRVMLGALEGGGR